ncbi:CST complex subunit STN1-like [Pomacea canaliculata]|uniref:CST complex subunit STN1-like n=1 Tax=Pomacea canaliculata TaxID=400727 RepID=UPI000D726995|nr:CST complex subunit STN1-like [Pomacea canaliculata]XP_025091141.1 CST complex subunit STN1-like [Pomacea canaliculata]XP_025091142.1 CST complex subunit STN1-like [Pomacea canaliculata]XP_025091143.1 CST complex subunit STN1-like [Pomacea canaliculata]
MSSAEETSDRTFYPPKLWGLSSLFNVFNKLYIRDIIRLKPYPGFPGAFAYGNHPVFKVDVVGIVVKAEEKDKIFIYAVDDGTGVVSALCWKRPFSWSGHVATPGLPTELQSRLTRWQQEIEVASGYQLGHLIHVRGKLKVYRGMMEIVASYHRKIENPSEQVARMMELPTLYRQCYNKPFILPCKLAQELQNSKTTKESGQGNQAINMVELTGKIKLLLKHGFLSEFSFGDLLEQLENSDSEAKVGPAVVRQALCMLEDTGMVCCRRDCGAIYENLTSSCHLDRAVLSILKTECCKSKYKERGCHYLRVLDELRKTVQYSGINERAVLAVLDRLETDSDVMRTADKSYLPVIV